MKYLIIFLALILTSKLAISQQIYGNEWINYSQSYYKIKIAKDGVYKIDYNTLNNAGIDLTNINPKNISLYRNGREEAIYIKGESDLKFDTNDFLVFYGKANTGETDLPLYENPNFQSNPYFSLYTDTACYFLTINNVEGKRMTEFNSPQNLASQTQIIANTIYSFNNNYYGGAYILAQTTTSEYSEGEGYGGSLIGAGQSQTFQINTPDYIAGTSITTNYGFIGRSNASSSNNSGFNHHTKLEISSDGSSFNKLLDTTFRSYKFIKNAKASTLAATNQIFIKYNVVNDLGAATDYQAPTFFKVDYFRDLNLSSNSFLLFKPSSNDPILKFVFSSNSFSSPQLFDLKNNEIIFGTKTSNSITFTAKNSEEKGYILFDEATAQTTSLEKVNFTDYFKNNNNPNFFIVTHPKLSTSANDYENYRKQTGFKTLKVNVNDLYDQYYYGITSPLAIRNFTQYIQNKLQNEPKYLLLLGKGLHETEFRYGDKNLELVPTIGYPASDAMYSAPLYGNDLAPIVNISRIAATNNEEVEAYLNKLKTYESKPDFLERKNIIHISGGGSLGENLTWSGYQNTYNSFAAKEYFGDKNVQFHKNVNQPITNNLREKIVAEINKGASFVSFLGHGSSFSTEINFGEPGELGNDVSLFYLINGCLAGNPNTSASSIGENFINQPNKGAIGWIATSDEAVASYLAGMSNNLYRNLFKDNYGLPVSYCLSKAIKDYQQPSDVLNRMLCRQINFQGDPAVKFYSPNLPDYYLENGSIFIATQNATTNLDSIKVGLVVKNLGKAVTDKLQVSISRKLADNTIINYPNLSLDPVYNTDTIYFNIPTEGNNGAGNNTLIIKLDPQNLISELNELNNNYDLEFLLPGTGVNLLYPKKDFVVNNTNVNLLAQQSNLFAKNSSFIFELDTTINFNSTYKQSKIISANALAKASFTLLNKNNQNYFWRVKIDDPQNLNSTWQQGSFLYSSLLLNDVLSINHNNAENTLSNFNIVLNNNNKFEFTKTSFFVTLQTRGDDAPTNTERTYRSDPGGRLAFAGYEFGGFTLVAFSPLTSKVFSYPSAYNFRNYPDDNPKDYTGQYFFNLNSLTDADSLVSYIKSIPKGFHVVGFNGRANNLKNMTQNAKDAFKLLGCNLIQNVEPGEPYMFFGKKGNTIGDALEFIPDRNSSIPPKLQEFKFTQEYNPYWDNGYYQTNKIGPVSKWESLVSDFSEKETSDQLNIDIFGYDRSNNSTLLQSNITSDNTDLSFIDAKKYPYISVRVNVKDAVNHTPIQLNSLFVKFKDISETTFDLDLPYVFHADQIQEGDSLKISSNFKNISRYPTDSISVYSVLTKTNNQEVKTKILSFAPLQADGHQQIDYKLSTLGLVGTNNLKLQLETNNDSYGFNNQIKVPFTVKGDNKQPLLNITFDGKNIINREIVSPSPNININLKDENEFILLKDTSVVEVYIKEEKDQDFKRVYYRNNDLVFNAANNSKNNSATINYNPKNLKDGIYTLKVKSKDQSGNLSSTNDYQIDFEVINESTITNFYPYPNPVVNSMKFVFTLTGDKIPDKIKIQISNMSGKIVREVLKSELGNIKIGNNISDFSWDGTDQFGDRLANGVYFYKVFISDNENDVNKRNTSGDAYFKNQMGKIYLLK
jgi:hypothetical protein